MAKFLLIFLLLAILSLAGADGVLSPYYYLESCPLAEEIVRHTVEGALYQDPRIAAGLLRLHFHDCFVLVRLLFIL